MAKCKIAEDSSGVEEKFDHLQNPKMRKLRHKKKCSSLSTDSSPSSEEQDLKSKTGLSNITQFPKPPASLTGPTSKGMNIRILLFVQQCF